MKTLIVISLAALLAGCVDNYSVAPGGSGSTARIRTDARECRDEASNTYLWQQGHGVALLGMVGGIGIGGAVGGAIAGGATASLTSTGSPPTLDEMIEACMKSRGYVGASKTG